MPISLGGSGGIPGVTVSGTPVAGQVLSASSGTAASWKYPPGFELDYVELTAGVTVSATSEATATTIVSSNAVTFDGATAVIIEVFLVGDSNGASQQNNFVLYDGASSIGIWDITNTSASGTLEYAQVLKRKLTPSAAAHTYSVRGYKLVGASSFIIQAGAGGSGNTIPGYIRITVA